MLRPGILRREGEEVGLLSFGVSGAEVCTEELPTGVCEQNRSHLALLGSLCTILP